MAEQVVSGEEQVEGESRGFFLRIFLESRSFMLAHEWYLWGRGTNEDEAGVGRVLPAEE